MSLGVIVLLWRCCRRCNQRKRPWDEQAGVLRSSFLGGTEKLPAAQLAAVDVPGRWAAAAGELFQTEDWSSKADSWTGNPARATLHRSASVSQSSGAGRKRRGAAGEVLVMFSNDHVQELQPAEWYQNPLGQGSYGMVYEATWRGHAVAVKVLKLPERSSSASDAANAALRVQVEEIIKDFATEVEICCDLNHPNLVRLLGYADRPQLMIMQELLRGGSMDKQLYVECWRPTHEEVWKAAHDVARGMEYLHTMFATADASHAQPIIHRDLKTPNLMLATRPADGDGVLVKVTDFGLSRDKALTAHQSKTAMMTGCGSVLWMAPEILLGDTYNEKIDVFSYAMCLLELVDCHMPWTGVAIGAAVPNKVTRGHRPTKQLKATTERPDRDEGIAQLIQDCWAQDHWRRPDFTTIILRLEEMMGIPVSRTSSVSNQRCGSHQSSARQRSSSKGSTHRPRQSALEQIPEQSRPASPDLEEGAEGSC